ncbi:MAG: glucose-1-phosphate adenylyltransferase [Verrucomicrobiae bacterium]|nr:glucose-1-phosphate adenylyltransferase [Verrucomicrobiae bacterium]MDW8344255.1 glucose-1-phosphate adenylyltransferase [Verrucomicrobiae bacterium]
MIHSGRNAVSPSNVLAVIMGGGAGTRLFPLTKERAKPAVPIGGKYRLVDVPISNCINSQIRQIYVLTQFNSASLHRHIYSSYTFDKFSKGFVEILAAQQTTASTSWYQGTADAVRQNLRFFLQSDCDYFLILSGDQLYRMDFRKLLQHHVENSAQLTVATIPVGREQAPSLGIMQTDADGRIVRFVEKPKDPVVLEGLKLPGQERWLASMGIYLFNRDVLVEALDNDHTDFGKHVIPESIKKYRVFAYVFEGYWEDVGTIRSFFEANLAMCGLKPAFSFFDRESPIYTRSRFLPPSKIIDSHISQSLVADGCVIVRARIEHCIVGLRSFIGEGCVLKDTIIMGCDYYAPTPPPNPDEEITMPHMSIGRNCQITRAIIDKNVHIEDNVVISDKTGAPDYDGADYYIRDGIVIVPKNTTLRAGTRI